VLRSTDWLPIFAACLFSPVTAALVFELTKRPVEEVPPPRPFAQRMTLPGMTLIAVIILAVILLIPINIRKAKTIGGMKAMEGRLSVETMPEETIVTAVHKDFYKKYKEYPFLKVDRGRLAVREEFKDRYRVEEWDPDVYQIDKTYFSYDVPDGGRSGGSSSFKRLSKKQFEKYIKTVPHIAGRRVNLKLPAGEYEIHVEATNYFKKIFDVRIQNGTNLHREVFLDKRIKWMFETDSAVHSKIATADLTGDGLQEVVFTLQDGTVYCLSDSRGWAGYERRVAGLRPVLLWRFKTEEASSPPVVGDLDGDGQLEVVVGSGNKLYCLSGQYGELVWEKEFEGSVGILFLGDFDGDGLTDILTSGGEIRWRKSVRFAFSMGVSGRGQLRCLSGKDGRIIRTLPEIDWQYYPFDYRHEQKITLVDWNRDGISDILYTTRAKTIACISGADGSVLLEERGKLPALGDVDNDEFVDVVFTSDNRLKCLSSKTG